jgi:hypothetical protein
MPKRIALAQQLLQIMPPNLHELRARPLLGRRTQPRQPAGLLDTTHATQHTASRTRTTTTGDAGAINRAPSGRPPSWPLDSGPIHHAHLTGSAYISAPMPSSRRPSVDDMRGIMRGTKSRIFMGNLARAADGRVTKPPGREQMRRCSSSS